MNTGEEEVLAGEEEANRSRVFARCAAEQARARVDGLRRIQAQLEIEIRAAEDALISAEECVRDMEHLEEW